jgi:putative phosphoesterase
MDNLEISKKFPEKTIIELGGVSLGLIHGRGAPSSLLDYVKKEFLADLNKLDIIIFGHTHYPCDKIIGGKAYFNPGSPTDTTYAPYRSYGIMEIEGKIIKKRILKIE